LITVRWNTREIGQVDANFLASIDSDKRPAAFTLAGKPWEIITVEWSRGLCAVRPAPQGRAARWSGSGRFLGYELCQSMRRVLLSDDVDAAWSARAQQTLGRMRAEYEFLDDSPAPLLETPDEITWWTFAGGAANLLLAKVLEAELGPKTVVSNTNIRFKGDAAKSVVAVRQAIEGLAVADRPNQADARHHSEGAARHPISKFQPCLPEGLLSDLLATRLLDVVGAKRVLATE
jgi:ATP-dependent Lhr-like helicase